MVEIPNAPFFIVGFRITILGLASLLGCLAAWILVPEFLHPAVIQFPTSARSAASGYLHRDAAIKAARIGLVRGDLWAQAALADGNLLLFDSRSSSNAGASALDHARSLVLHAVTLAPHDSRMWLLLGAVNSRFDWLNERASADLRMSYYTGSNLIQLVPQRLKLSIQSQALKDDDFQELVRHDIRIAVTHKSELLPALVNAYNNAPQTGQQFMQKTLSELDPSVLPLIYAGAKKN
jgi:hypothetical protein